MNTQTSGKQKLQKLKTSCAGFIGKVCWFSIFRMVYVASARGVDSSAMLFSPLFIVRQNSKLSLKKSHQVIWTTLILKSLCFLFREIELATYLVLDKESFWKQSR